MSHLEIGEKLWKTIIVERTLKTTVDCRIERPVRPASQGDACLVSRQSTNFERTRMSRSRLKRPFIPITTASSEKNDKRLANRKLRRLTTLKLRRGSLDDDLILPEIRDVSNVYLFSKDGKIRMSDPTHKDMRK